MSTRTAFSRVSGSYDPPSAAVVVIVAAAACSPLGTPSDRRFCSSPIPLRSAKPSMLSSIVLSCANLRRRHEWHRNAPPQLADWLGPTCRGYSVVILFLEYVE